MIRNQRLAVRQTVGFVLLTPLCAVLTVGPLLVAAAAVSGVAQHVVLGCAVLMAVVTLGFFGYCVWRSFRIRAEIDARGILVSNLLRTRRVEWAQLAGTHVGTTGNVRRGVIWRVADLILRDSDRVVRVRATFAFTPGPAAEFIGQLRFRAPAGSSAVDDWSMVRTVPPPDGVPGPPPSARYVVRCWIGPRPGYLIGTWIWTGLCALAIALPVLILASVPGGLIFLAVAGVIIWSASRWTRPRLVVTSTGMRLRHAFARRKLSWEQVRAIHAKEYVNQNGNRRRTCLTAVTGTGEVTLLATDRTTGRAVPIRDRMMAYAPATLGGSTEAYLAESS